MFFSHIDVLAQSERSLHTIRCNKITTIVSRECSVFFRLLNQVLIVLSLSANLQELVNLNRKKVLSSYYCIAPWSSGYGRQLTSDGPAFDSSES